jgi:hypothetical protein
MYQSYSGFTGLLILAAIVIFTFWIIFAAGSFLLGTPVGLALLTLLIVRHYWRRHQLQKAMNQAEAQWQQTSERSGQGYGSFGGFGAENAADAAKSRSRYMETDTGESGFDGVDRTEYSAAEDVQYKELNE